MNPEQLLILSQVANTIRGLAIDMVQKADSGHPGLPMGCAELGAYLYGVLLQHSPQHPHWINRDRFVLSAGHGSAWLYSCLHLAGFPVSLEDLKNFRQLHSKTPGHPECTLLEGVETTTGPLGQGVGHAVGMALALKILEKKFNTSRIPLSAKVYALAGDGCMMEGVSSEVSSLAGHLCLDNFVLIYDANQISLDGPLNESCSENTKQRYEAYGWEVLEVNGNDLRDIDQTFSKIKQRQTKPTLVIAHTVIGKGSPHKAGTHKVHGAPLGKEEVELTKKSLGIPLEPFFVPQDVTEFFRQRQRSQKEAYSAWENSWNKWQQEFSAQATIFEKMRAHFLPKDLEDALWALPISSPVAGRKASQEVIQLLAAQLPQLYGGSADLSCSDLTEIKGSPFLSREHFEGRNIKYGVREFGMATIATGLAKSDGITPYIGTFLTFSDYMRNSIRLAALQQVQVIYQFTHDSIFLGEDGPTHQPVEHLASLRAIPGLQVIRPADANEVKMAWLAALRFRGPTALILSRQNLPLLEGTKVAFDAGLGRGAYLVQKEQTTPDFTLIATGSELSLALDVASALAKLGKQTRVVSMPCWELFERQDVAYRESILGGNLGVRVSIEAAVSLGWHRYIGREGVAISVESFGESAPAAALAREFGFTVEAIVARLLHHHGNRE